jgi:Ribbon-helix-helix protein, copG family
MTQMIRKQIYVQKRQDTLLKRMAKARGVSEAEIIREAIDQQIGGGQTSTLHPDPDAFEQAYQHMLARRSLASGEPYNWRREDAYKERLAQLASKNQR